MKTTFNATEFKKLSSDNPRIKYGFAKKLVAVAQSDPELLYPHFEYFVAMLKHENNILKWIAIDVLGLLARVDRENKIDKKLNTFVGFLRAGKLITANHSVSALGTIAIAKPTLRKKVSRELLKAERYTYETAECRNIVLGKIIEAFGRIARPEADALAVMQFVERQTNNRRAATRKKASIFLKRASSRIHK
ncbi:MAG TPA: hypothetical protein VII11_04720 [Bacteroidota bacterium]